MTQDAKPKLTPEELQEAIDGIRCPNCASPMSKVNRTVQRLNRTKRYRQCERCRRNFTTTEVSDDFVAQVDELATTDPMEDDQI